MSAQSKLAFGIEIELLLKPKPDFLKALEQDFPQWAEKFESAKEAQNAAVGKGGAQEQQAKEEAEVVRKHFRGKIAFFLTNLFNVPTSVTNSNFLQWSVVDEVALNEIPEYCKNRLICIHIVPSTASLLTKRIGTGRVEFVSRTIPSDNSWQSEIDRLFRFLDLYCWAQQTTGCSMHIHVSPSAKPRGEEKEWEIQHLNRIVKALSYLDDSITRIMPPERKDNPWAASNMSSKDVEKTNTKLSTFYKQVEEKTWKPLFDYYDAELRSNIQKRQTHTIMGGCRYVAWNFEHITDVCGTIEFRRSPAVGTAASAKHWASFALGFIFAAAFQTNVDWTQVARTNTHPPVESLAAFIESGIQGLEATCHGALRSVKEDNSKPRHWTAEELEMFLKKKTLLESCVDPDSYVQKVRI